MAIKDFKVETGITVDGVKIDVSSGNTSGGVVYSSSSSSFISSIGNVPIGVVRMWASGDSTATPPDDYLICDGRQDLSQTTYASLYAVIRDRFTTTPNGSTFGLPSFNNTTTNTYPIAIGHDKTGDLSNPQVKPLATTKATGASDTTAHTHTSGSGFATNAQSETTPTHSHVLNSVNTDHGHTSNTNSDGSHNHTCGDASTSSAHSYQAGGTGAVTSQASANHDHTGYSPKDTHNHGNVSSSNTHTHGTTTGRVNGVGITDDHSHDVSVSLTAQATNHAHTVNSSGFYFIIRYR